MTEEQIEEIELILNGSFIDENNGEYNFEIFSVLDTVITFDTNYGLVNISKTNNLDNSTLFCKEELQDIIKACEEVLEW